MSDTLVRLDEDTYIDPSTGEILDMLQQPVARLAAALHHYRYIEKQAGSRARALAFVLLDRLKDEWEGSDYSTGTLAKVPIEDMAIIVKRRQTSSIDGDKLADEVSKIPLEVETLYELIAAIKSLEKDRIPDKLRHAVEDSTMYTPTRPWVEVQDVLRLPEERAAAGLMEETP